MKVPRDFVFMPELPRNLSGKVLKTELRKITLPGDERHVQGAASSVHLSTAARATGTAEAAEGSEGSAESSARLKT